jgi:formate dehydrogenase gamma subunit
VKKFGLFCILCLMLACTGYVYAGTKAAGPAKLSADDCLACHNDGSMVNGKEVHGDNFKASVHGSMFSCVDCHKDVKSIPHQANLSKPTCETCHADEKKHFDSGIHARANATAEKNKVPNCESCHNNVHEILPASDPKSRTARVNIPKTCGQCHSEAIPGMTGPIAISYQESVHGRQLAAGNTSVAVCTDCHRSHDILPPSDPTSPVYRSNVPKTCAQCHSSETKQFDHSIHGKVLAAGNTHAPVCVDCHGVHTIKAVADVKSPVFPSNQADLACAQCHNNVQMVEFGIPGGRTQTYKDSYHGMAMTMGSKRVASCSSCHGAHDILPASDPQSSVNRANLAKTCGQCHPGANANFARGQVHLDPKAASQASFGSNVVAWTRRFYIAMIIGVIGFMALHNGLIFVRKLQHYQQREEHFHGGPRVVERMTKNQRIQHALLFLSFFTLVVTGFTLKFPNTFFHHLFVNEEGRSIVHRIAGVLLIGDGIYHLLYLAFTAEGRRMFFDMLPEPKDATDLVDVFAYYLGFSSNKPQFKRFNYAEKMEYWALVWGTFVMAVTGFMIWFKVITAHAIPRWWVDVATTVHLYEAVLATLAIIVWHFYQVILDPDTYPMNFAFFDGKVSLEHYQEEHGLDSATLSKHVGKGAAGVKTHHVTTK